MTFRVVFADGSQRRFSDAWAHDVNAASGVLAALRFGTTTEIQYSPRHWAELHVGDTDDDDWVDAGVDAEERVGDIRLRQRQHPRTFPGPEPP